MLPGVSATATMRPQVSAKQWIFVVLPPRETPNACVHSPFSAGRGPMRLHMRAVEHQFIRDCACCGDLGEDPLPDTTSGPAGISVLDRLCRAVCGRHIAPARSCLEDVEDAADDAAVIKTACSRLVLWQMRLQSAQASFDSQK